jgi:hypothetical protein
VLTKIVDLAREKFPEKQDIPVEDPNYKLPDERFTFDVSSAEKQLGMTWIPLEKCVVDLLTQLYSLQK